MPQEDKGFSGTWELPILDAVALQQLRDIVGQVQLNGKGQVIVSCKVNLRTGVVTYP